MNSINRLTSCLAKLQGIGRRSAERIAVSLVRDETGLITELASALEEAGRTVCCCSRCGSITSRDNDPCGLCMDSSRDSSLICVVETPADISAIEKSGEFKGLYHSLMGKLSPMKGDGPESLRIQKLVGRVDKEGVKEVLLALSTDVEGDSTASYISELLSGKSVVVSRLAYGLPAGSGIMYSDPVTLAKAVKGRMVE